MSRYRGRWRGELWYSGREIPGAALLAMAWPSEHDALKAMGSLARSARVEGASVFLYRFLDPVETLRYHYVRGRWRKAPRRIVRCRMENSAVGSVVRMHAGSYISSMSMLYPPEGEG